MSNVSSWKGVFNASALIKNTFFLPSANFFAIFKLFSEKSRRYTSAPSVEISIPVLPVPAPISITFLSFKSFKKCRSSFFISVIGGYTSSLSFLFQKLSHIFLSTSF